MDIVPLTAALLADVAVVPQGATAEAVLFWVFATVALGSGIAMVAMRNIVHAALMLVLNFLCIAGLYLGLQSGFLSIVQVIVYAGAIVVLFLFVIMLLGVHRDDLLGTRSGLRTLGAVLVGVLLAGALLAVVGAESLTTASACGAQADGGEGLRCAGLDDAGDSVSFVASRLFTRWTFVFELAALLLVVATLGALVLGRRRDPEIEDHPLDDPSLHAAARELDADEVAEARDDVDDDAVAPEVAGIGAGGGDGEQTGERRARPSGAASTDGGE